MQITFCRVDAEGARTSVLELADGATLAEAFAAAGVDPGEGRGAALWGRRARMEEKLRDGDRVDWCASLLVDPKAARRERAERQGDVRYVTAGRHGGRRRA